MSEILATLVVVALVVLVARRLMKRETIDPEEAALKERFAKQDADDAAELDMLRKAYAPLIAHAEDLNRRMHALLQRDYEGATQDLKRERLEGEMRRAGASDFIEPTSMALYLNRYTDRGIPYFQFLGNKSEQMDDYRLGPAAIDDTENWERKPVFVLARYGREGETVTPVAHFDLDQARTFFDRVMAMHIEEMPFGYTADMIGLKPGSVNALISENRSDIYHYAIRHWALR